jgi:sec-independent protein translocase protein TatC
MTTVQDAKSSVDERMSLTQHLTELRTRIFRSALAIVVVSIAAYVLYDYVQSWLLHYYRDAVNDKTKKFVFLGPLDGLGVRLTVSSYIGLFGASPVWIWQGWRFIAPGLKPAEKRYAIPFILSSVALFLSGGAMALWTLPPGLDFLVAAAGPGSDPLFTTNDFVSLVTLVVVAFGFAFLFPVVLVFLQLIGAVTPKRLLKGWRYAIVIIFVIAAVITPSQDPFTLFGMAGPMVVFYFGAIGIGKLLKK